MRLKQLQKEYRVQTKLIKYFGEFVEGYGRGPDLFEFCEDCKLEKQVARDYIDLFIIRKLLISVKVKGHDKMTYRVPSRKCYQLIVEKFWQLFLRSPLGKIYRE